MLLVVVGVQFVDTSLAQGVRRQLFESGYFIAFLFVTTPTDEEHVHSTTKQNNKQEQYNVIAISRR